MSTHPSSATAGAYRVEMTDTLAGEANYCWVRRATIPGSVTGDAPYNGLTYRRRLARAALTAVGADGARGRWTWNGDAAEFRPYGQCVVVFVNWDDSAGAEVQS